ncbi:MAG: hypothetical protein WD844_15565 [Thermoleophilaceae bacterium]
MLGVQLDALLLRGQLPDLMLRPGGMLAARVVDRASISIAGIVFAATLPGDVAPGDTLRLRIDEATPERLLLRVMDDPAQAPPAPALPLPGERQARVRVEEQEPEGGPGARPPSVTLSYESPVLGRLDLRLELPAGAVTAAIAAAAGEPAERAGAAAEELRAALERATGREAHVAVTPRHDPFETYA